MTLTILCVTEARPYAWPFLRAMEALALDTGAQLAIGADGHAAIRALVAGPVSARFFSLASDGFVESVLDEALTQCDGRWVLRLDDDERCSPAMVRWLRAGRFMEHDHWKFPRMHLWPDEWTYIVEPQLWPDWQTRLSVREKAGGRRTTHAGSPFGGGHEAPCVIEHHKFLVRSRAEREDTARRWHGGGMKAFSLPEDVFEHPRTEAVRT